MFRRKTIDDRRKISSSVILFAGAVFALLSACSDSTDTAGVISETESGKTIAGIVTDFDGNTIKGAKVALMRSDFIAVRNIPEMETTTDDSGKFSFEDIKIDSFNIQVSSDGLLDFRNILDITMPEDSVYRFEVSEGSNLKLELNAYDLALGDTICIDGSLNCFVVNSEDVDRGYILADGIPNAYFEKITIMTAEGETETDSVYWSFRSEDTLLVTRDKPGYLVGLRKMTFNDSVVATLKAMDSSITLKHIPILVESKSETVPTLIDANGYEIDYLLDAKSAKGKEVLLMDLPEISANMLDGNVLSLREIEPTYLSLGPHPYTFYNLDEYDSEGYYGTGLHLDSTKKDLKLHKYADGFPLFEDGSLGFSFWIKGEAPADTGFTIFSSTPSVNGGFEIRQCSKDPATICTRIYSGLETASTDTTLYGSAKILDGSWHHYFVVFVQKHLTIAVDGKTIRNTDIKISDDFSESQFNIDIGGKTAFNGEIDEIFLTSFDDSIRAKGDTTWQQLQSWLSVFYELQKEPAILD